MPPKKPQRQLTLKGMFDSRPSKLYPVYKDLPFLQSAFPIHKFENAFVFIEHKQRPLVAMKQLRLEAIALFKEATAEEKSDDSSKPQLARVTNILKSYQQAMDKSETRRETPKPMILPTNFQMAHPNPSTLQGHLVNALEYKVRMESPDTPLPTRIMMV
jgi:hypothetical protein